MNILINEHFVYFRSSDRNVLGRVNNSFSPFTCSYDFVLYLSKNSCPSLSFAFFPFHRVSRWELNKISIWSNLNEHETFEHFWRESELMQRDYFPLWVIHNMRNVTLIIFRKLYSKFRRYRMPTVQVLLIIFHAFFLV